jgi:hypothetical protein
VANYQVMWYLSLFLEHGITFKRPAMVSQFDGLKVMETSFVDTKIRLILDMAVT